MYYFSFPRDVLTEFCSIDLTKDKSYLTFARMQKWDSLVSECQPEDEMAPRFVVMGSEVRSGQCPQQELRYRL